MVKDSVTPAGPLALLQARIPYSSRVRETGLVENEDGSWKESCYGVRTIYKIYM
jgi:hypothetical protein